MVFQKEKFKKLLKILIICHYSPNLVHILHCVHILRGIFLLWDFFTFFGNFWYFFSFHFFGHKYLSASQNFSPLHPTLNTIPTNMCTNFETINRGLWPLFGHFENTFFFKKPKFKDLKKILLNNQLSPNFV